MAIRVTQQFVQYVADPSSPSDLRVTRLFAQVATKRTGIISVSNTLFAAPDSSKVELQGGDQNVEINQRLFNGTDLVEPFFWFLTQSMFAAGPGSNADQDVDIVQYLNFTPREFVNVGNILGFGDSVSKATLASVSNTIFGTVPQNLLQAFLASNTFGLTDAVISRYFTLAQNEFEFLDLAVHDGMFETSTDQTGGGGLLKQTLTLVTDANKCVEEQYAPFVGSSDDSTYDAFDETPPTFGTGTLTLSYPTTAPTNTLTLDEPDFGDNDTNYFTRIDRQTRGGERKIFADPDWAKWERIEFTVSGLCQVDADGIIEFLNASLAKKIRIDDWKGRAWEGKIIAPETDITNEEPNGWRFECVFEGVQV